MKALTLTLLLFISSFNLFAQLTPQVDSIPMSDGKKLAADIYIPSGTTSAPVILIQTPYNRLLYRIGGLPLGVKYQQNSSNYIFVILDWRGFYGSIHAAYAGAPSNGKDGYDAVEWIAQQSWCNGKIGTWGASALGRVQFSTAKENPPHLSCICPLVAGPQYSYSEYYPGGCLRTEYVQQLDELGFGLSATFLSHPVKDAFWNISETLTNYPDSIRVPALMIGGWYDHTIEQMLPFFSALRTKSPVTVRDKHRLVMGPWVHKGVGFATAGQLIYPDAENKSDSIAIRFFDFYLRGIQNGYEQSPVVQYYQMGENTWLSGNTFPPTGIVNTKFYMHGSGLLDNSIDVNTQFDSLTLHYNPDDPSPTIGGPTLRTDLNEGPYDQQPQVESRNDILIFTTATLTQDVVMQGNATVHLRASSNRKDTDFAIRLTDVYPDGRSMLVNDGILRMRFRKGNSVTDTAAIIPGTLYDFDITLPSTCITFLAGHKIRVDITSSNYPRFNRNANTGGNMYPGKSMDSLQNAVTADNTVYFALGASYLTMPLVGYTTVTEPVNEINKITARPNPVTDWLTVTGSALQSIEIKSLLGQTVYSGQMINAAPETSVDVSGLVPGIYLLSVKTKNRTTVTKFVKQ